MSWLTAAAAVEAGDFGKLLRLAASAMEDRGPSPRITTSRENGGGRPRGYADWRPQRKTRLLLEQVDEILAEYADHLPLTVRQIFYRMVGNYGYEKTEAAYSRLSDKLVRARRACLIPFEYLRDDGIFTCASTWYSGPNAFWDETGKRIKGYKRDRQMGQRQRIELWCEAAGMVEQLARVANNYSIPVYSGGGFGSLSAVRDVVDRVIEREVPTLLLHVGDHDPSGVSIFKSFTDDVTAFVERDRVILPQKSIPVRVALTAQQVEEHDLPTAPPKPSDGRAKGWSGETCQLEALPPDTLAEIIKAEIESVLDLEKLSGQIQAEQPDQAELYKGLPAGDAT